MKKYANSKTVSRYKAFTLIELLAVIVILAIIALIATPIIMNVIKDSQGGSNERSTENILGVTELYFSKKALEIGRAIEEDELTFPIYASKLEYKGIKPTGGTIYIGPDGIAYITDKIIMGDYTCGYESQASTKIKCSTKPDDVHARKILAVAPDSCFNFNDGTGTINGFINNPECPKEFAIPSTIDGVDVTSIENRAFSKAAYTNPNLTNIINKTGRSFDWKSITEGSAVATFITGTVPHSSGNITVSSE